MKKFIQIKLLGIVLLIVIGCSSPQADNVEARSIAGSSKGKTPDQKQPFRQIEAKPGTVLWTYRGGTPSYPPAISPDGTIFVVSGGPRLSALDASDGTKKWDFEGGWNNSHSVSIGRDGTAYFADSTGRLYAIDGKTGKKRWRHKTTGEFTSTAIDSNGFIYTGTATTRHFYCLDDKGQIVWKFEWGKDVSLSYECTSPAIGRNGLIYFGSEEKVYAITAREGLKKWEFKPSGEISQSPAIGKEGIVYIGSDDGIVYALDGEKGSTLWEFKTHSKVSSSPVVGQDGTVFIGARNKKFYALDWKTGKQKWVFEVENGSSSGAFIDGSPIGAAIAQDGIIYITVKNQDALYALDAKNGEQKWKVSFEDHARTSPVIAPNGVIYFGSQRGIHAVAGSAPLARGLWPQRGLNPQNTFCLLKKSDKPVKSKAGGIPAVITLKPGEPLSLPGLMSLGGVFYLPGAPPKPLNIKVIKVDENGKKIGEVIFKDGRIFSQKKFP